MIDLEKARGRLALIWCVATVIIFLGIFLMGAADKFPESGPGAVAQQVFPYVLPTLFLVLATYAPNTNGGAADDLGVSRRIRKIPYWIATGTSIAYLLVVFLAMLQASDKEVNDKVEGAAFIQDDYHLLVSGFQVAVATAMGIFFGNRGE